MSVQIQAPSIPVPVHAPSPRMLINHPMPTQAQAQAMAMDVVRQHTLQKRRMQRRHPPRIRLIHHPPPLDPVHPLAAPITHGPGQLEIGRAHV